MLDEPVSGEAHADFDWAIEAVRAGCGASCALILARHPADDTLRLLALSGLSAPRAAELLDSIAERLAGPAERPRAVEENWLDPGDLEIARLFHITQHRDRAITLVVGFQSAPKGSVMRSTLALGRLLLPCIARFAAMRDALEREHHRANGLRTALDHINVGISVISASKQVEFSNLAMREIIEEHDGLRASSDSITATSLKDAVRLQVSIDHIMADHGADGQGHALMLALPRQPGKRPLMAGVLPSDGTEETPSAILFVIRPEGDVSGALVPICRLNGLSPVETRLACCLTMGKTLAEAARMMRIKQQTARTYLRQIFQKTGTNRQADLVRMMMSHLLPFFDRTKVEAIV
jgi:DNA-binding CsgD family transcriptional regulator